MRIRLRDNKLHEAGIELGFPSRDSFARHLGIASTTAYRVEMEKVEPSPKFIAALLHATGKSFDEVFEIVETSKEPAA